jgi:hypothetical protein
MENKRNGSVGALIASQKKSYTQELRERKEVLESEDNDLTACICGNNPTRNTYGVQDMGATLPCPYYECKDCGINSKGTAPWGYPGQWNKAQEAWDNFILNLTSRIK